MLRRHLPADRGGQKIQDKNCGAGRLQGHISMIARLDGDNAILQMLSSSDKI
jgi:hypothetical protein